MEEGMGWMDGSDSICGWRNRAAFGLIQTENRMRRSNHTLHMDSIVGR
jgi:hypothetical protein